MIQADAFHRFLLKEFISDKPDSCHSNTVSVITTDLLLHWNVLINTHRGFKDPSSDQLTNRVEALFSWWSECFIWFSRVGHAELRSFVAWNHSREDESRSCLEMNLEFLFSSRSISLALTQQRNIHLLISRRNHVIRFIKNAKTMTRLLGHNFCKSQIDNHHATVSWRL